jgi:glycosyltransferase involved in cell wall biosynthesis
MTWRLVVPSLKLSGGILEVMRLGGRLKLTGSEVSIISLWRSPHPVTPTLEVQSLSQWTTRPEAAFAQLFVLFARFWRFVRRDSPARYVFTHYATLPLSILVPRNRRVFFVQGLEWKFVNRIVAPILRAFIIALYRRGTVISANSYLTSALRREGVHVHFDAAIWADRAFAAETSGPRDLDFVMVVRKGGLKRLDLYRSFLQKVHEAGDMKAAVISTEDDIVAEFRDQVAFVALRPTVSEMRDIYARAKCFVHLSDHEGFGLPPLEAMGAGCVPVCRDSGGVNVYMRGPLSNLVFRREASIDDIFAKAVELVRNPSALEGYRKVAQEIFNAGPTLEPGMQLPWNLDPS